MSSDFSPELRKELLDDFYAECDEQLSHIRTDLATLESSPTGTPSNLNTLEGLFRNIHSLKGNSAIVGLRVAEELAHLTEDFLRPFSRGDHVVSAAAIDLLMTATQRLEQIVGAHRQKSTLPEIEDLREQLKFGPSSPGVVDPPAAPASASIVPPAPALAGLLEKARSRGLTLWQATFLPSSTLDQRGININVVRARFTEIGEIIRTTPVIRAGASMAFEFYLGLNSAPIDLISWEIDGISLKPLNQPEEPEIKVPAGPGVEIHEKDSAQSLFIAPSHIVRVDLSRLDDLMRLAGELVIHRSRLDDRIAQMTGESSALKEVSHGMGRSLRELRQAITRVRLVPVAEIFSRMPFIIRDLSRETKKRVKLVVEGQQTEIDKYLVERLKEPLLHLVRNAFSHGIESKEQRRAASKPPEGTIVLRAFASGESVIIQIRDDGQGIDVAQVAQRAMSLNIPLPEKLDQAGVLNLLCTPGFSTRAEADLTSGRGVGMAVVKTTVRELGGTLALETMPGEGTQFTLRLPLTLSIVDTLIVSVGNQTCAVPQAFVEEIVLISEKSITTIKQVEAVPYRDGLLPLVRLRSLFRTAPSKRHESPVLVVSSDRGSTGLMVDRVHTRREVVVRPMRDPLIQVPGIAGATELGDGRPVLILDAVALTQGAVRPRNSKR